MRVNEQRSQVISRHMCLSQSALDARFKPYLKLSRFISIQVISNVLNSTSKHLSQTQQAIEPLPTRFESKGGLV